jgi:hypothetical protein
LRDEEGGVDKVIRALKHRAAKRPRKEIVRRKLAYFRKHKKRMPRAELKAKGSRSAPAWSRRRARPW